MDLDYDKILLIFDKVVTSSALGFGCLILEIGSNSSILAIYKVPQSKNYISDNVFKVNVLYYVYDSIFEMVASSIKVWWTIFLLLELFQQDSKVTPIYWVFLPISFLVYFLRAYYGWTNYEIYSPIGYDQGAWINVKFYTLKDYISGGKQATAMAFCFYVAQYVTGPKTMSIVADILLIIICWDLKKYEGIAIFGIPLIPQMIA